MKSIHSSISSGMRKMTKKLSRKAKRLTPRKVNHLRKREKENE